MKSLDETMVKNLSFPDAEVEKMEFSAEQKTLKIFVDSAWLDAEGGKKLGQGVLFFNDWESLMINRFDSDVEQWSVVDVTQHEQLKDLCEVKFSNSNVSLSGFGKKIGHWFEWKILHTKMHAEFDGASLYDIE